MHLPKLLLVEDDRPIARALALALRSTYAIDSVHDGAQALSQLSNCEYALVVLDLNLPDLSGLEVCQQLRARGITTPVLILTGESGVLTKIHLLDAGANDYLTKPFSLGELKARLRVLQRFGSSAAPRSRQLSAGGLLLNRHAHTITREGVTIALRRKEFAVLECLMEHAGSVVTRSTLTRHAWHGPDEPWTNTIDVHVKYLRDKLDRPFGQPLIQTVHGLGYRLALPQPAIAGKK